MSVRTMRRRPPGPFSAPSQLMSRPWASKVLPLVRPLSARNVVTAPCASIFRMRLPAMSLKYTFPSASTRRPFQKANARRHLHLRLRRQQFDRQRSIQSLSTHGTGSQEDEQPTSQIAPKIV